MFCEFKSKKSEGWEGGEKMKIKVYVYRCTNVECRHIQRYSRTRRSQMPCDECGSRANLISTEEEGE